jgi:FlgD Ig-like domain
MSRSLWLGISVVLLLAVTDSSARKPAPPVVPEPVAPAGNRVDFAPGTITADVLQLWTFDNSSGGGDSQGWAQVDRTFQPPYFHVDTYGAITAPRGLWCGAAVCQTPDLCNYATLPGYGNEWEQRFQSIPFSVSGGDVEVSFNMNYDTEASYDFIRLEYKDAGNVWQTVDTWSGVGSEAVNRVIDSPASPLTLRIRFTSDFSYSDEDGLYNTNGAAFIDNLLVVDNGTPIDSHDFTAESDGATATVDGHWQALGPPAFGDYAVLLAGSNVVQRDPGYFDSTHLWGFFYGSQYTNGCGGLGSSQVVVPFGDVVDGLPHYIRNEIQSPWVSLSELTGTEPVILTFDVYEEYPVYTLVFREYRVRSRVAGVWKPWRNGATVYTANDEAKVWRTFSYNLRPLITAGATDIQVGIGVVDACPDFCGLFGTPSCHSQGPLFDNVRVTRSNTATGSNVVVQPVDVTTATTPVTVTFSSVTAIGLTTLVTGPTGPALPGSFLAGNSLYYNLSTTATTTGDIDVCITYNEGELTVPESTLRVLHWDTNLNPDAWVDITTSLDTGTNVLCGTTDHLSPFAIGAGSVTGVGDGGMPRAPALGQNVPNPFNPTTTISYDVPAGGAQVTLRIYDATGGLVRTLVDEQRPAGTHAVTWDGRNAAGAPVSSGVYFYQMTSGSFAQSRRMVLLK